MATDSLNVFSTLQHNSDVINRQQPTVRTVHVGDTRGPATCGPCTANVVHARLPAAGQVRVSYLHVYVHVHVRVHVLGGT